MATSVSRYSGVGGNLGTTTVGNTAQTQNTNQQTNSSGSQNTQTNNQSTTNSSQTSTTNTNTQNMSNSALAALNTLISQLMGGGTQQMAQDRANRIQQTNATKALQAGYSKEAAFADAQGAMAQQMRRALEASLPTITRAADSAGTSGGSMRALLATDASARAAENAAALGLKASVDYGSISANLANTLEVLTRPDTTQINALLGALNVAKGAVSTTSSQTVTNGTQTTNSSGTQNTQTQNQSQTQGTTTNTGQTQTTTTPNAVTSGAETGGAGTVNPVTGNVGQIQTIGALTPEQNALLRTIGTSQDNQNVLNNQGSRWDNYRF